MAKPSRVNTHQSFFSYKRYRYLKLSVLLCVVSLIGYIFADFDPARNGGTWYGYILGTIGTLLILWLTLLGVRKRAITPGNWSLKAWTSAHIYLGLSLVIVVTLHTGFQFGLNIHTLAYTVMMLVVVSGLFGIYFYAFVPRRMSDNRGEMGQAAMLDEILNLNRLLRETAQPLDEKYIPSIEKSIEEKLVSRNIFKRLSRPEKTGPTQSALEFLTSDMRDSDREARAAILDTISVLERKNSLLLRINKHVRFRALLEVWLYFHIPLTFALLAALAAHIVSVFFYS